ncbi:MAG TPA: efflux RND transporter periplasmic adaptor subunit [Deltaproteobacteria bacterium]|nr:efflux RND transporter periplasmic adaptor subunit [Deltaproteobacteria bacterium]
MRGYARVGYGKEEIMRKIIYLGIVIVFVLAVLLRMNKITLMAEQDAVGIEQYYKTNGIPVEVAQIQRGEFLVYCRVNALVMGLKQTEIFTPIAAKILKVHHQVGDAVKADEVIISLDKEDPRSSARYRQLKAIYETTLKNYNRMLELQGSGAVSVSQFDEIKMKLDVDRANLESVVKSVSLSSPMDGVLVDINAREGELISPMKTVATVARVDRVRLIADVSESDVVRIMPMQKIMVNGMNGKGQSLGRVTKVSLNANPKTGLFHIEMEADNSNGQLRIGTYTTARIEVLNDPDALYADLRALQTDPDGNNYVYVVVNDHVTKRMVERSGLNDDYVRISSGVTKDDKVVVSGFKRLGDNIRVVY